MAGKLSKNKTAQLRRSLERLYHGRFDEHAEIVSTYSGYGKSLSLDLGAYRFMREAIEILQSVDAWKAAYPPKALGDRIAWSMMQTNTLDDAVVRLLAELASDTKEFIAYAPIFGFNLVDGARMTFGKCILEAIGEQRVESEIIDRLRQHAANLDEKSRSGEIERIRKLLETHKNVPILLVPFYGSMVGAFHTVEPVAERVAAFVQFAIGMLTDENTHIIDHTGRFTGEFSTYMPVLTPEFDELGFPNVRGIPYRQQLNRDRIARLEEIGVLNLAETFIQPQWTPEKSIDAMLCRAASCFADGERAVTDLAKIVSYVSAVEVLFGKKDEAEESFCLGLAVASQSEREPFPLVYNVAKDIYEERSLATHKGLSPTLQHLARRKAVEAILKVLSLRETVRHRNDLREWVAKGVEAAKPE